MSKYLIKVIVVIASIFFGSFVLFNSIPFFLKVEKEVKFQEINDILLNYDLRQYKAKSTFSLKMKNSKRIFFIEKSIMGAFKKEEFINQIKSGDSLTILVEPEGTESIQQIYNVKKIEFIDVEIKRELQKRNYVAGISIGVALILFSIVGIIFFKNW